MGHPEPPYVGVSAEQLILRDYLAIDRTVLANERTLLAYIRTALGLLVAGASFLQFFSTPILHVLGWVCCAGAVVTVAAGVRRYRQVKRSLQRAAREPEA